MVSAINRDGILKISLLLGLFLHLHYVISFQPFTPLTWRLWGGTQRLPRLVGTAYALELFFTATPITADKALAIGLVDEIADDPLAGAVRFVAEA